MKLVEPESVPEALEVLAEGGPDTKVIAGGTALTLLIRQRLVRPETLVSLRRAPGLDRVELEEQAQRSPARPARHPRGARAARGAA